MTVRILEGDCRDVLLTLPDGSVQTCVTSPPYWGLRDYDALGQIGLELSVNDWLLTLVHVFREVRRVLADDGTLWLNLGDAYSHAGSGARDADRWPKQSRNNHRPAGYALQHVLKPKDLIGMPWRVAFALQADGWYLRSDIIWHKPNPMPESVTDRPTKAHEYIFLLSKSERYYYDHEAIKEPAQYSEPNSPQSIASPHGQGFTRRAAGYKTPDGWDTTRGEGGHGSFHKNGREKGMVRSGNKERKPPAARGVPVAEDGSTNGAVAGSFPWEGYTRNKRSVWTVPTKPFKGAHFATFPPDLIKPCILAGCREGGTVLDPFGGAGTTGLVADRLRRNALLIELNPTYAQMARERINDDAPLFADVT